MEEIKRKTSEAQARATKKYHDQFERVNCRFIQGTKKRITDLGYTSINDFIKLAVADKLEKEEKILK